MMIYGLTSDRAERGTRQERGHMYTLQGIASGELGPYTWDNEPIAWACLPNQGLRIYAPSHTDLFLDPLEAASADTAPFMWVEMTGDFVARLRVQPSFQADYDAGGLVVRQDDKRWIKLAYERTDLGNPAIVSVVTNGVSDDANGADLNSPSVWLQLARVGDVFALHYALDGEHWRMTRLCKLPMEATVKVGAIAQSPRGVGCAVDWLALTIESRTLAHPRDGK